MWIADKLLISCYLTSSSIQLFYKKKFTEPGDNSVTIATTLEMFLDVSCNVVSVYKSLLNLR